MNDNQITEAVVNAACEAAWPEFRSHLEGQQAWIDADPLRQNRLRLIVTQTLIATARRIEREPCALARCEHSDTSIAEEAADALEAAQAEIEALRRDVEEWKSVASAQAELHDEAEEAAEKLVKALAELITWFPSADTYRRLGFDPEAPMLALERAKLLLGRGGRKETDRG